MPSSKAFRPMILECAPPPTMHNSTQTYQTLRNLGRAVASAAQPPQDTEDAPSLGHLGRDCLQSNRKGQGQSVGQVGYSGVGQELNPPNLPSNN